MDTEAIKKQMGEAFQELHAAKERLTALQKQLPGEPFDDHAFTDWNGNAVNLSELFGGKDDLIVVHNMGTGCSYCTMWADGFNGVLHHLENRVAFVVVSPDDTATQKAFAESRGWNFKMVSAKGSDFTKVAGYEHDGSAVPGVSAFFKSDGAVHRNLHSPLGPGDPFCSVWHLFDLLKDGADGWQPKFDY